MKDCEYTRYLWKGRAKTIRMPGSKQSFDCPRPKDGTHRTQKPVELFDLYVRNSTNPGDIVLDPFSGSGTTALAAMRSGRQAVGIELDPDIFRISVLRLQEAWNEIMSNGPQE
jgi:site-specific DNA-methyltransferase (adenine-specific)